jgi:predicted nucleic acid-binding protein
MDSLLDSNILIYSASPDAKNLQVWLSENTLHISDITLLEVLGYHKLTNSDRKYFERFFSYCNQISISPDILQKAISLRQYKSMSLGDSIIAGTALVYQLPLVTLNHKDFRHIENLLLIDPLNP